MEEIHKSIITMDDIADCIETPEQTKQRLEGIEKQIFAQHNIKTREELIQRIKNNTIDEDELLSNWHAAYAGHMNDVEEGTI